MAQGKTIEIDLQCRVDDGGCGRVYTYKPPSAASREIQDAVIERYLRRLGWTGTGIQSLICAKCSKANA